MVDHRLEALRRSLRARLRDATGDVAVPAADLRTVLDELGRLQQANERLRRQNRRVRLRLQRAGLEADGEADAGGAGERGAEPEGDDVGGDGPPARGGEHPAP